jgi:hypothetical protein
VIRGTTVSDCLQPGRSNIAMSEPNGTPIMSGLGQLAKAACWGAVVLIGMMSAAPGGIWRTGFLSPQTEHLIAYFAVALLLGLLQSRITVRILVATGLCLYAGVLEAAQIWIPGRSAAMSSVVESVVGVLLGTLVSTILIRTYRRYR